MLKKDYKKATLAELAELVGGTAVGDGALILNRVAPINLAAQGDITFVANPKYIAALESTDASAVIVNPDLGYDGSLARIEVASPYLAFAKVLTYMAVEPRVCQGIAEAAHVSGSAVIAEEVTISPGCYVGEKVSIGKGSFLAPGVVLGAGVTIGEDCLLHPGVVIREECRIGNRVILQPNAVIGSDGFGFAPDGEKYYKIPQVGIVVLEDDVEIGSCSCVDRAALGETLIRQGTKIDNGVQVGHNVEIGENSILVAHVAIAGSTVIGKHCTFGGQSGAIGHVKVGDNVTVVARGSVSTDVEGGQYIAGFPTMEHKDWLKASTSFARLPEMRRELSRLRKKIEELENRIERD
ncbi:MAG: UDP-3-O-(3-hydroxymyristoyl)glucosamine N-acyltransferase [Desulfuromonas sp.]|nr:MAG: UDP-3-O-(3-hydroxymyristoyl)glucosamine N-acyltransferase [Desulfuromonas sp.]